MSARTARLRAVLVLALVAGAAFGATTAFAAIGDGGVVEACTDSGGNVKLVPALPCPKGFTSVGQIYTKTGADAAFLTKAAAGQTYLDRTGQAADADLLDGMDSSEFMPLTNCIGYPHEDIDWHGCQLRGANLDEANLAFANLLSANLFTASLVRAVLRHAGLQGAVLRGADLSGADLTSADLSLADLSGADLTDSHLLGASMSTAIVFGVKWGSFTTCPDGTTSFDNGRTCVGHLTP